MSQLKNDNGADQLVELLKVGGEASGRIFGGLMSSPWTAIPTALLVLSQIDKNGKLTAQFLENLATFLAMLGNMAKDVAIALGQAIAETLPGVTPPPPIITTGAGNFCVRIDINSTGRFFLSIFPIFSIVPASEACFPNTAVRDLFYDATVSRIGSFIGLYNIQKVDK